MDSAQAVRDIKSFLLEAGDFALQNQKSAKTHFKDGEQIVTETDIAVSHLARKRLASWLDRPEHLLIDEESIDQAGTPSEAFAAADYLWALDPIDGTAGYALGRKMWGVSLGVFYKGEPLIGGIYLPALRELLLADATNVWRTENVGLPDAQESEIRCVEIPVNSQVFVEGFFGEGFKRSEGFKKKVWMNTPESAVQGFYSALTLQAAGTTAVAEYSLWDAAAGFVLAQRAGFKIRSLDDGRDFVRFSAQDFKNDWKMNKDWLLCAEGNFDYIREAVKGA